MAVLKPMVICGKSGAAGAPYTEACNFGHAVLVSQHLIYNLVMISTLIAVVVFIFAGFKLLTSGGKTNARDDAKTMFMKVLKGYLWILVAWLLIYTITDRLVDKSAYPSPLIGNPQPNPVVNQ